MRRQRGNSWNDMDASSTGSPSPSTQYSTSASSSSSSSTSSSISNSTAASSSLVSSSSASLLSPPPPPMSPSLLSPSSSSAIFPPQPPQSSLHNSPAGPSLSDRPPTSTGGGKESKMSFPLSSFGSISSPLPTNQREVVSAWEKVEARVGSVIPCQRSLHSGALWRDNLLVFGGYDGHQRVNDLHIFNFTSNKWSVLSNTSAPSPRDRHIAAVYENELFIFGGFDGHARVNDMHAFNLETNTWRVVSLPVDNFPPSPRHSHTAVVYKDALYCFGGYDGSYKNDFHRFDFSSSTWSLVPAHGEVPRARYRGTCVVIGNKLVLFGGHDGNRHLQDTSIYDFDRGVWSYLQTEGVTPSPRDSHIAVVFKNSMFIYGGSTGSAMGDFHELRLDLGRWTPVSVSTQLQGNNKKPVSPGSRFCHIGLVYDSSLYIFGGYDSVHRLNDFYRFRLTHEPLEPEIPPSTLVHDLKRFVNNDLLSDITFIVEGIEVPAHKVLCLRCPYFHNMLTGEYMESRARSVVIEDVKHSVFVKLLEYLYSDHIEIGTESAMELLHTADRFGVERLKKMCENVMLRAIDVESVSLILFTADEHNASDLRERCISFILSHFDEVSKTSTFAEMGRANFELVIEILNRR